MVGDWALDGLIVVRTALPVDLTGPTFAVSGAQFQSRPNVVSGIPVYLYGDQYPGGKILNNTPNQGGPGCKGPFCPAATGQEGTLGRDVLRGFPAWQVNGALRRQFRVCETTRIQFRAELFNLLNHPNFGPPNTSLASALFGQSTQMLSTSLGSGGTSGGLLCTK